MIGRKSLRAQSATRADLVLRAIAWLDMGHWNGRAMTGLKSKCHEDSDHLALIVVLLVRLGGLNTSAACRCLNQPRERCRWALAQHHPSQDTVTEWARLIHEALLAMERMRGRETMRSCRRPF